MKLAWLIALVVMLIGFAILFRPPRIDETMAHSTSNPPPGQLEIRLPERIKVPTAGRLELSLEGEHERHVFTAIAPRAVDQDDIDWNSNRLVIPRVAPGNYTAIITTMGPVDARDAFRFTREVSIHSGDLSILDFSAE